jgi:hypothetical protein
MSSQSACNTRSKTLLSLLSLVSVLSLAEVIAPPQVAIAGTFDCDGRFYQIRADSAAKSKLYRIDRRTIAPAQYGQDPVFGTADLGVLLNGMGFNKVDKYLYAIYLGSDSTSTNITGTTSTLGLYKMHLRVSSPPLPTSLKMAPSMSQGLEVTTFFIQLMLVTVIRRR